MPAAAAAMGNETGVPRLRGDDPVSEWLERAKQQVAETADANRGDFHACVL